MSSKKILAFSSIASVLFSGIFSPASTSATTPEGYVAPVLVENSRYSLDTSMNYAISGNIAYNLNFDKCQAKDPSCGRAWSKSPEALDTKYAPFLNSLFSNSGAKISPSPVKDCQPTRSCFFVTFHKSFTPETTKQYAFLGKAHGFLDFSINGIARAANGPTTEKGRGRRTENTSEFSLFFDVFTLEAGKTYNFEVAYAPAQIPKKNKSGGYDDHNGGIYFDILELDESVSETEFDMNVITKGEQNNIPGIFLKKSLWKSEDLRKNDEWKKFYITSNAAVAKVTIDPAQTPMLSCANGNTLKRVNGTPVCEKNAPRFDNITTHNSTKDLSSLGEMHTEYMKAGEEVTVNLKLQSPNSFKQGNKASITVGNGAEKELRAFTKSDTPISERSVTYTIENGDNGLIKISSLDFQNLHNTAIKGFVAPYEPKIQVIADTTPPVITPKTSSESATENIYQISVTETNPQTIKWTEAVNCDAVATTGTVIENNTSITINKGATEKKVCLYAEDKAGNITKQELAIDAKWSLNSELTKKIEKIKNDISQDQKNIENLSEIQKVLDEVEKMLTNGNIPSPSKQQELLNKLKEISIKKKPVEPSVNTPASSSSSSYGGGGGYSLPITSPAVTATQSTKVIVPATKVPLSTQKNIVSVSEKTFQIINPVTPKICTTIDNVEKLDNIKFTDVGTQNPFYDDIMAVAIFRPEFKKNLADTGAIVRNSNIFSPQNAITRAEFIKMITRSLGCHYEKTLISTPFSDVEANAWYEEYIAFAHKNGWINGYSDGKFRPNTPITREEAAKILARSINLDETEYKNTFADVSQQNEFKNAIAALYQNNIFRGNGNLFSPKNYISRQEVARIIYRTFLGGKN